MTEDSYQWLREMDYRGDGLAAGWEGTGPHIGREGCTRQVGRGWAKGMAQQA